MMVDRCPRCKAHSYRDEAGAVGCRMCGWADYDSDDGMPMYQHSTLTGIPRTGKYPQTTPRVVTRQQKEQIRAANSSKGA